MALSIALIQKLHGDYPLKEKVDIVRNVFPSYLPLTNKDIIFDWLCTTIEHFIRSESKIEGKEEKLILLWDALNYILKFEEENTSSSKEHGILLKSPFAECLSIQIRRCAKRKKIVQAQIILQCCHLILSTPSLSAIFTIQGALLFQLLSAVLQIITVAILGQDVENDIIQVATQVLSLILTYSEVLYKQSNIQNEIFCNFLNLLEPAVLFSHAVHGSIHKDITELDEKLHLLIARVLFSKDLVKNYKLIFQSLFHGKNNECFEYECLPETDLFRKLYKLLHFESSALDEFCRNTAAAKFMEKILEELFKMFRDEHLFNFHVVVMFIYLAGFHIPLEKDAITKLPLFLQELELPLKVNLIALERILHAYGKYSQHFFFSNSEDFKNLNPIDWFQRLEDSLLALHSNNLSVAWFGCFDELLNISSAIIEPKIVNIFQKCYLRIQKMTEEAYLRQTQLLCNILATYVSLRQVPKLLSKLFLGMSSLLKESDCIENFAANISSLFLQAFIKCIIALPIGQTLEIWNLFLENMQSLENSGKKSISGHNFITLCLHLTYQLFITFLLHIKVGDDSVPQNVMPKVEYLMNCTKTYIANTLQLFKNNKIDSYLEAMVLIMTYTWGEVHLLLKLFRRTYCIELQWPEPATPISATDLTYLHNYLNNQEWNEILHKALQAEDKTLVYPVVLLLLQKAKALSSCSSSNNVSENIKIVSSYVISILLDVEWESCTLWNRQIVTITPENYPIPLWNSVLAYSPIIIPYLDQNEIFNMSSAIIAIMLEDEILSMKEDEENLQMVVRKFLNSTLFPEMKSLHTSFISALWKYIKTKLISSRKRSLSEGNSSPPHEESILHKLSASSKLWANLAETAPKIIRVNNRVCGSKKQNKELNKMWVVLKNIADMLNSLLESNYSPKRRLDKKKILKLIKVLNHLPLEYLVPGNQVRCLLGLSLLLLFVDQVYEKDKVAASHLLKELCKAMIAIFDGVRSIWLFDFVNIALYLKTVVKISGKFLYLGGKNSEKNDLELWILKFLDNVIAFSVKNTNSLQSVERFTKQVNLHLTDQVKCFQNEAVILSAVLFLQKLISVLHRPYIQEKYKTVCHDFAHHLCSSLTEMINNAICKQTSGEIQSNIKALLFCSSAVVLDYACEQGIECKCNSLNHSKWLAPQSCIAKMAFCSLKEDCELTVVNAALRVIEKFCLYRERIGDEFFTKDFILHAWTSLQQHLDNKERNMLHCNVLTLDKISQNEEGKLKDTHCKFKGAFTEEMIKESSSSIYKDVEAVLSGNSLGVNSTVQESNLFSLSEYLNFHQQTVTLATEELNVLSTLLKLCTYEEFQYCIEDLLKPVCIQDGYNAWDKPLYMKFHILTIVINAICDHLQMQQVSKMMQKVLGCLHCLEKKVFSLPHILNVLIPALHIISAILKKGKNFLPRQDAAACLYFCSLVPLNQFIQQPVVYCIVFEAVYMVLNEMLIHHLYAVIAAASPFIISVSNLLKSVISASDQDLVSTYQSNIQNKLQLCAQNIDRLMTRLSEQKTEFSKTVPYIVADYINEVQHITVHPCIKPYLIAGIYRTLDMCSEHSINMLLLNLSAGGKEIFKALYSNYNKNYRYRGRI